MDGYRKTLKKYFAINNVKLAREFEGLYDTLHIAGYYRGLIYNVDLVKDSMKAAKEFIEKVK